MVEEAFTDYRSLGAWCPSNFILSVHIWTLLLTAGRC